MKKRTYVALFLSAMALFAARVACANEDSYPNKPITIVVPFSAGGISDNQTRLIAEKLSKAFKQSVVVLNKVGASGMIGAEYVARSQPDGYTLLYGTHGTQAANLALYDDIRFNPPKDLKAVHSLWRQSSILVTGSATPYKTLQNLIDAAKAAPGKINYGSAGKGTQTHLAAENLQSVAGVEFTHVPYKGSAPALTDLIAGQIDIMFNYPESTTQFIQQGKLRALAVNGANRLTVLPDVKTMGELGYPDAALEGWSGIFAPAGTPDAVISKLAGEIAKATHDPKIEASMKKIGSFTMDLSGPDFQKFVESEVPHWRSIVESSGAKNN
ncbi:tripartite tricarboxylate transporter substrate binding protein [Allopusillimonas soli]|uniref:Tripartite tricarboxylate transporter substrate binding protein n=1 Tax=Allopusillimonas soli TaxID=659016 RepID=A0A853F7H5_9BURK|nr:tripartite tricarboxylate transporter substrate binding protein [Allopusillimonas soli]NYT35927.1 tripartite tricarboxylate transporter substrate binding protein [Allopusillimonas soli]TEA76283.1 tripartite tricarboxylate transporter substrate binding protein [Allopusillimonas soli]